MNSEKYLKLIFISTGFIFLRSSFGKFQSGNFVNSLAPILKKFASQNPFPIYKSFLEQIAIPNAGLCGMLTMWGELFAALTLVGLSVYLLFNSKPQRIIYLLLAAGFLTGAILNAVFWLASGWTSPSTDGLNLLMFLIEVIGFVYSVKKFKLK